MKPTCHLRAKQNGLLASSFQRADSGFYSWQAIEACEKKEWRHIVVARKTARLVDQLQTAKWKRSPLTDADGQCEFLCQLEGWGKDRQFLALRYSKPSESKEAEQPGQYQLFDTPAHT